MDCPMKAKCKAHFRRGEAACRNCTSDDPQRFETDTARAESVPDWYDEKLDGGEAGTCEGDSDGRVTDEYGNEGDRMYEVVVVFERAQTAKRIYHVAADDESDAKDRALEESGAEDCEDLEWEDMGDGTTDYVDSVEELAD